MRRPDAVARAGDNELLIGFMSALPQSIRTATNLQQSTGADIRQVTARPHARITDAIRAGRESHSHIRATPLTVTD
ncbi:hypothetical protein GCM10011578_080100 [Streptomyces fuscichromogenes]|uniref:Uncharacterized protein n=1 Tax=Streptomyces fuscichromogenes TaxID=1324013 RepID=A0A918CW16_9ACTN|nr:hypothetical protein GCM10011578_080100 [Streptomyces fuscichromogenes]